MDVKGDVTDLAAARTEIDHLHQALKSRLVIGQAEGICMERLGIDADQAFEFLKRVSSTSNRKLVEIAAEIAKTRGLPTLD
jgi:AmiR/NasT family two-component response regulator